jgi:secernin
MWGAEMGCNEHGVCIGNEALFCVQPASLAPALTGMDLLRLALERADSATAAVDVIAALLKRFGQGGAHAASDVPAAYHNAFLIVDRREAWHMECVGDTWAAGRWDRGLQMATLSLRILFSFSALLHSTTSTPPRNIQLPSFLTRFLTARMAGNIQLP